MALLESPRFNLRSCNFQDVRAALKTVGHAVLDNVWNLDYLRRLHDHAEAKFRSDDARIHGNYDAMPDGVVEGHLGGTAELYGNGASAEALDREFFLEVERSGLPACYRHLTGGSFVVATSERVVRRVDPAYPLRFIGLHCDGQLWRMSDESPSDEQFTLWTPLQPCTDDFTPRLLLLHRGETWLEIFADDARENGALAIQLKPLQIRDESTANTRNLKINSQFDTLFERKRCFAPPVPFGSAVIFERDIVHGSYTRPGMTTPRYSLDFRTVHDYRITAKNRGYTGYLFSRQAKAHQQSAAGKFVHRVISKLLA